MGLLSYFGVEPTSLLGNIGSTLSENSNLLLGYGANGAAGMLQGAAMDEQLKERRRKLAEEEKRKQMLSQAASKLGIDPMLADAVPDLVGTVAARKYAPKEPRQASFEERLFLALPKEQQEAYVRNKFIGAPAQQPAPSGYAWQPDGKLAPIPGGPQDPNREMTEPLPAEIASRFGLAKQYDDRFSGIEKDLLSQDPKSVGAIDQLGFGQSGALQRDMKLGSEALSRMLTGAGMSQSEADNEVKQYLPSWGDSPETLLDKQYRLRGALRDMQREALKGRRSQQQIDRELPRYEIPTFDDVKKRRAEALKGGAKAVNPLKQKYGLE